MDLIKEHIRAIPDFPKPGIMFRDVTTLFAHPSAFRATIDALAERIAASNADVIAGVEARGFILGAPVAEKLGLGFAPVRKRGKLPWRTISESYELEYGSAEIEVHEDAAQPGQRVALVDDLIATGGTGLAAISLMRRLKAEVCIFAAVVDLPELGGAEKLRAACPTVEALVSFDGH